ncbi:hypothetical protein ACTA71_004054 [Dictyostelium dimigraforme]
MYQTYQYTILKVRFNEYGSEYFIFKLYEHVECLVNFSRVNCNTFVISHIIGFGRIPGLGLGLGLGLGFGVVVIAVFLVWSHYLSLIPVWHIAVVLVWFWSHYWPMIFKTKTKIITKLRPELQILIVFLVWSRSRGNLGRIRGYGHGCGFGCNLAVFMAIVKALVFYQLNPWHQLHQHSSAVFTIINNHPHQTTFIIIKQSSSNNRHLSIKKKVGKLYHHYNSNIKLIMRLVVLVKFFTRGKELISLKDREDYRHINY